MPWAYNYSGPSPSYTWTALNTLNQGCAVINIPSTFAIRQISCLAGGYGGSVLTRLAVWSVGGGVITQSPTFTMPAGSASVGGQSWQTQNVSTGALGAGNYWVGLYRNPTGGHVWGTASSGTGTQYRRTNTSGFPNIYGMESYETENKAPFVGIFYITVPNVISSASVTRNNDNSQTINWSNDQNGDRPYNGIWVDRWDNVANSWYNIGNVGGGTTSFTDTSTIANRTYQYRVIPYNEVGSASSHTYTSTIKTTPEAPSNVVASRSGTTVNLTWVNGATNETAVKIQSREYTTSWGAWGDETSLGADSTSWNDTTPYAIGQYRVRTEHATLQSSYVESNQIVTIVAPNAPTNLQPNLIPINGSSSNTFTWTHNPVDGTSQTKYSIRYRVVGGSFPGTPQINNQVGTVSSHSFPSGTFTNGNDYEWQVATYGQSTNMSPWSSTSIFYARALPVATITKPTIDNYTTSNLSMIWTYTQSNNSNQKYYIAKLKSDSGVVLENKEGTTDLASGQIQTLYFTYNLSNNTNYTVTLQVQESKGSWSTEVSVSFLTAFYTPSTPTITASFDSEIGKTVVNIVNPSPSGTEVATSYNKLYRSVDNINWDLVATNIPINTSVIDSIPKLNGNNYYKVEAVSSTPTIATSTTIDVITNMIGCYILNAGENFQDYIILKGDTSLKEIHNIERKLRNFEGRTYPVRFQGTKKEVILDFSCDLLYTQYNELINIIESNKNIFYRDYLSRCFYCTLLDCTFERKDNKAYQFSCKIYRVEV